MQTRRSLPRLVAAVAAALSCISVVWGTYALAKIETEISNRLEKPLELGNTVWALRNMEHGDACSGYLSATLSERSELNPGEEGLRLALEGMFRMGLQGQIVHAKATGELLFDTLNQLVSMDSRVLVRDGSIRLRLPGPRKELHLQMEVGTFLKVINLGQIDQVYLTQEGPTSYRLRLPRSLESLTREPGQGLPIPQLTMREIPAEEKQQCKDEVSDSKLDPERVLLPLDEYLSFMRLAGGAAARLPRVDGFATQQEGTRSND